MVRPQERLQIALVVRAAFRQWNAMIYFVGGIEQETAALRIVRIDTAARTPPILRRSDIFGLEWCDASPSRCSRRAAVSSAWARCALAPRGGDRTRRPWQVVVPNYSFVFDAPTEHPNRSVEGPRS